MSEDIILTAFANAVGLSEYDMIEMLKCIRVLDDDRVPSTNDIRLVVVDDLEFAITNSHKIVEDVNTVIAAGVNIELGDKSYLERAYKLGELRERIDLLPDSSLIAIWSFRQGFEGGRSFERVNKSLEY
ncbi:hypothetical protein [Glacieibacterium frigidum]|uniref:Uncharacterized protein n=1 Tax=Glacieibacterium frigidum TaxID=2593303 RepID=A0A552U9B2_9SPHN|nr:hypothetical protein [Glacieibacterium frigidum]TRW14801.1 hypothetical protein FMM06_14070 [Glacieibacterium frigidum]